MTAADLNDKEKLDRVLRLLGFVYPEFDDKVDKFRASLGWGPMARSLPGEPPRNRGFTRAALKQQIDQLRRMLAIRGYDVDPEAQDFEIDDVQNALFQFKCDVLNQFLDEFRKKRDEHDERLKDSVKRFACSLKDNLRHESATLQKILSEYSTNVKEEAEALQNALQPVIQGVTEDHKRDTDQELEKLVGEFTKVGTEGADALEEALQPMQPVTQAVTEGRKEDTDKEIKEVVNDFTKPGAEGSASLKKKLQELLGKLLQDRNREAEKLQDALVKFISKIADRGSVQADGIFEPVLDDVTRQNLLQREPFSQGEVHDGELDAIVAGRVAVHQPSSITATETRVPSLERLHQARLMGLAFSGGGIRSATFNLGVLQQLAQLGLLKHFDYLSTVSGGGYIGGWLHAWVHREAADARQGGEDYRAGIAKVEEAFRINGGTPAKEPKEVSWLRRYSNYLTPRAGLLSGDTMTGVATWLRNVLLNQLMLALSITAALAFAWLGATRLFVWDNLDVPVPTLLLFLIVLTGVVILFLGLLLAGIHAALARQPEQLHGDRGWQICLLLALGSLFLAVAFSFAKSLKSNSEFLAAQPFESIGWIAILYSAAWLIGYQGWALWANWKGVGSFRPAGLKAALSCPEIGVSTALQVAWRILIAGVKAFGQSLRHILPALAAGAVYGGCLVGLSKEVAYQLGADPSPFSYLLGATVLPPLVLIALLFALVLHIGLAGRVFPEVVREWWSRAGGILLRYAAGWLLLMGLGLFGGYAVVAAGAWAKLGGLVWIATTVAGVIAGRSAGGSDGLGRGVREMLIRIAPYFFILGLLLVSSWSFYQATIWFGTNLDTAPTVTQVCHRQDDPVYRLKLHENLEAQTEAVASLDRVRSTADCDVRRYASGAADVLAFNASIGQVPVWQVWVAFLVLVPIGLTLILGWRVDINTFSLHMFYRNRLERCYLGASLHPRRAHPWIDLGPNDSPSLCDLKVPESKQNSAAFSGQRPYPLINTAINLTRARNLAWQERKAASFLFTPDCCGYELPDPDRTVFGGYAQTDKHAHQKSERDARNGGDEFPLSQAITISGAAASPNAGFHTNPASAVLMTIFNARLGWWIRNPIAVRLIDRLSGSPGVTRQIGERVCNLRAESPSDESNWEKGDPRFAPIYLLKELFASTAEDGDFVYLSDGGHFENLGLYELLRRRCRYIVVCDAGCDPGYSFEDLGNAIRKCDTDLGIPIQIDTRAVIPSGDGVSSAHCAIGRIHYDQVDHSKAAAPGYLLYLKASVTGDEPADVRQYKSAHDKFPHESTGDQWFSESQFESYRALGEHVVKEVFAEAREDEIRERRRRGAYIGDDLRQWLLIAYTGELDPTARNKSDCEPDERDEERGCDREVLFQRLGARWHAPSRFAGSEAAHNETIRKLLAELRSDPRLRFLDGQLYAEWGDVADQAPWEGEVGSATLLPSTEEELRAGFYFCNSLIQLMQAVYTDLHLELEHDRPGNRGWMNLFRQCAGSTMFRVTWAMAAPTCSARFQQYCRRHLDLDVGRVVIGCWQKAENACNATPGKGYGFPNLVECHELKRLKEHLLAHPKGVAESTTPEEYWDNLYYVPLMLKVQDSPAGPGGDRLYLDIGFAAMRRDPKFGFDPPPTLVHFRIRDHLRKMGLGRRGLEAIWREDCRMTLSLPESYPGADQPSVSRLWHSVLAAVPDQEIKSAERMLRFYDFAKAVNAKEQCRDYATNKGLYLMPTDFPRLVENDERLLKLFEDKTTGRRPFSEATDDKALLHILEEVAAYGTTVENRSRGADESAVNEYEKWLSLAVRLYERALHQQPDNEEALRGIARVFEKWRGRRALTKGKENVEDAWLEHAVKLLSTIIEANEFASLAYWNRACYRALMKDGSSKHLKAIFEDLRMALRIRPDFEADADTEEDLAGVREIWTKTYGGRPFDFLYQSDVSTRVR